MGVEHIGDIGEKPGGGFPVNGHHDAEFFGIFFMRNIDQWRLPALGSFDDVLVTLVRFLYCGLQEKTASDFLEVCLFGIDFFCTELRPVDLVEPEMFRPPWFSCCPVRLESRIGVFFLDPPLDLLGP